MYGSQVNQAGILDQDFNIDGTALTVPGELDITPMQQYAPFQFLSGFTIVSVPYRGAWLPDQPRSFQFSLRYQLSTDNGADIAFLEGLAAAGGVHTLVLWKMFRYQYTMPAGQSWFYFPRPDAYSKNYANKADAKYQAIIKRTPLGGATTTPTVSYKASVLSTDTVTAGQVWISNTAVLHPDTNQNVALFKFGTAATLTEIVTVDFHPLFNVYATQVLTQPFTRVGREDKDLYLIEVN